MRRIALVAVAVSLSAGIWAPTALGATDPQPSGEPAIAQPGQGRPGDRPQGDPSFHHRGHRGGPGLNGEPPQGGPGMNGQQPPDGQRGQGNGQGRPERPRWGGQDNGQPPQNGASPAPGMSGDPNQTGDGQRPHGQWSGPRGHHHGRPGPDGSSDSDALTP